MRADANLARKFVAALINAAAATVVIQANAQSISPDQERAMVNKALGQSNEVYFDGCDGYGPAAKSGDGMTAMAREQLGIRPMLEAKAGDTVRRTPTFGVQGIANCGAALNDLQRFPNYWVRRVSLLRARALHRFAMGDTAGADIDLKNAEVAAVEPTDPFYARSLKLDLAFERAFFLSRTGREAEAEALAMAAWLERPFSRETTYSAIVAIGPAGSPTNIAKLNQRLDSLDPGRRGPPMFLIPPAPKDAGVPSTPTTALDAEALYDVLPEAEAIARIASAAGAPPAFTDADYKRKVDQDGSGTVASFYSPFDTLSIGEEQSLLRAAIATRAARKHGFRIVHRQDIWRMRTKTLSTCSVYLPGLVPNVVINAALAPTFARNPNCSWTDTYDDGFETDLDVTFVALGEAGATQVGASDHPLDADAIYAVLAPVYLGSTVASPTQ